MLAKASQLTQTILQIPDRFRTFSFGTSLYKTSVHPYPFLIVLAAVGFVSALSLYFNRHTPKTAGTKNPLNVLLYFLTPTCSLWPQNYMTLSNPGQPRETVKISLNMLVEDLIAGKVELRSPEGDLKRLLAGCGKMNVEGLVLSLSLGSLLRLSGLWWWIQSMTYTARYKSVLTYNPELLRLSLATAPEFLEKNKLKAVHSFTPSERKFNLELDSMRLEPPSQARPPVPSQRAPPASLPRLHQISFQCMSPDGTVLSVLPALLSTLPSQLLRTLTMVTTLDFVPRAHFERAVHEIQSVIPPGNLALLEFTSCEKTMSVWSKVWVLSSMPFFYAARRFSPSPALAKLRRPRTASPFTNTLPDIITLLESGVHPCVLLSIQNVSAQYAQMLNVYAQNLEEIGARDRFLASFGNAHIALCAWRSEMLWARWEAACYASGLLTRWVICARRPSM